MAGENWKHTISCIGDSLTHNTSLGFGHHQMYPAVLQGLLRGLGCKVSVRNFGMSGDTTGPAAGRAGMTTRLPAMWKWSVPDISIIYGGTNDPAASITQAQTQANLTSMITSLQQAGCSRIIICGQHFMNYTVGGDVQADGTLYTADLAQGGHAPLIVAQKAAVTAAASSMVVYCDLFNYFRTRIVNGQEVAKSFSWYVVDQNYHFNAYGWSLMGQALLASIQAQGWDALLK